MFWWVDTYWLLSWVPESLGLPLFVVLAAWKWAVWLLLVGSISRVYARIGDGTLSARRAFVMWSLPLLALVFALAALREPVANWLDEATSHMLSHDYRGYPRDFFASIGEEDAAMNDAWRREWSRGEILVIEVAFVLVVAALNTSIGARLGHRKRLAIAAAVVLNPLVAIAWGESPNTVIHTYDEFHAGVLSGQRAFEFSWFFIPRRLESAHASLVYAVVFLANEWLLGQSVGRPAREKIARGARGSLEPGRGP